MTTVHFRRKEGHRYSVSFPYSDDTVKLVKMIPTHAREWHPEVKEWWILDLFAEDLANLFTRHGYTVVGFTPRQQQQKPPPRQPPPTSSSASWATVLLARVGPEREDAVFRALTKVLHPDNVKTGDHTLQRELIEAREKRR